MNENWCAGGLHVKAKGIYGGVKSEEGLWVSVFILCGGRLVWFYIFCGALLNGISICFFQKRKCVSF